MKFMHLSDLHLGIRIGEASLLEDQAYILEQIAGVALEEKAGAVILAGDIYDKTVPPAEAVKLFDSFLTSLAEKGLYVFIISGNHDSAERLAFASGLLRSSRVYISPGFNGGVERVTLEDGYGKINVYLFPFIKAAHVKRYYPDAPIESAGDAVEAVLRSLALNRQERNLLIAHQFVTAGVGDLFVGGTDSVDAALFEDFDYTALGHIHSPQNIGSEKVRYCGSPLKYSFSEAGQTKSATLLDIREKGAAKVYTVPLKPLRDLREIRGTYLELTDLKNYKGTATDDYLHVTLTDEEDIPDVIGRLRSIYPNILRVDYDNTRTRSINVIEGAAEQRSPLELFEEFYLLQNNGPLSDQQRGFIKPIMDEIWKN